MAIRVHPPSRCSANPRILAATFLRFQCLEPEEEVEKLGYMHTNPMKRGPALHSRGWIWSSVEFYAARESNTIRIDPVAQVKPVREKPHRRRTSDDGAPSNSKSGAARGPPARAKFELSGTHQVQSSLRDFLIFVPLSRHSASLRAGLSTIAPPALPARKRCLILPPLD